VEGINELQSPGRAEFSPSAGTRFPAGAAGTATLRSPGRPMLASSCRIGCVRRGPND